MNSFTYLIIGYTVGALVGSGFTFFAVTKHYRQKLDFVRIPWVQS